MATKIKVGVIGSGAMGSGIAYVAAAAGHQVLLFDTLKEQLAKSETQLKKSVQSLVEKQKISAEKGEEIVKNISFVHELNSFSGVSLVIEAIVENLAVKQDVFRKLEGIVSAETLLASNTSSLSIASIASACKNPERVMGIHFFNPAQLMPLVEIIPALRTSTKLISDAKILIESWGKLAVLTKDTPGFIVNRVARSYYGESIRIYEEGIADFATIDWALKEQGGFKMGPFELMDFIGNDINYKVTETVWEQFFYEPRFKPSLTQKRLFESGMFGRKTGQGYYDYAADAKKPEPKQDGDLAKQIFLRVICMLINEAVDSLYLQLANREDIDTAMTKGVNYPKGLLAWCDELGAQTVLKQLQYLYELYGEDRYRPCVLLKKMASEGKKFY